nr:hypothetical protein [uncultured Methanoregula sp.]
MGSSKDVMATFAERDIRQRFSEHEGWNVAPVGGVKSPNGLYRASRNRGYYDEIAFVSVSIDQVPQEDCILGLDALPASRGSRVKKYLLTPQATDTSSIPPHVGIILMNAFAFDRGELVWLTKKKHARRFSQEQAVSA